MHTKSYSFFHCNAGQNVNSTLELIMTHLGKRERGKNIAEDALGASTEPHSKKQRTSDLTDLEDDSLSGLSSAPVSPSNRVITLDVGGIKYKTTLQTLTGYESMLKARFSGNYSMKPLEDGSYFFDRDGRLFQYILKFLRNGKLSIPETWSKIDLQDLLMETQYFAVTAMLDKLSLRFFDSKILENDSLKQRIISIIRSEAKDYLDSRDICPTNGWVLRSQYDISKDLKRGAKKWRLAEDMNMALLSLTLFEVEGWIYGKFKANSFIDEKWIHRSWEAFIFRCPAHPHFDNPDNADRELVFFDKDRFYWLSAAEKEEHKEHVIDTWIHAAYPLAVVAVVDDFTFCDFMVKMLNKDDASLEAVQKIEVWHIPSRSALASEKEDQDDEEKNTQQTVDTV